MFNIQRPRNIDEKLMTMLNARRKAEEVIRNNGLLAFSHETLNKLNTFLPLYEKEIDNVKIILNNQTDATWLKQKELSLLRMHVKHFITVFNFAIDRGTFTISERSYYGLDPNSREVPYISSEADTVMWAKKIIEGEKLRVKAGNKKMTNPSIDEMSFIYDKYLKYIKEEEGLKNDYHSGLGDIGILINEADEIIKDIWDEVLFFFRKESDVSRMKRSMEYGIIFNNPEEIDVFTDNSDKE